MVGGLRRIDVICVKSLVICVKSLRLCLNGTEKGSHSNDYKGLAWGTASAEHAQKMLKGHLPRVTYHQVY